MNVKILSVIFFSLALALTASLPAIASVEENGCHGCIEPYEECCQSHDVVAIDNEAVVGNRIEAKSSTGGNWAGGSYGGNGGEGGAIMNGGLVLAVNSENNHEGGEVEESSTGNGGNGGNGGIGGAVMTGNATTEVDVMNGVNTNDTEINRCACQSEGEEVCSECCNTCGTTHTLLRNRAMLGNDIMARAKTGYNDADGSYGGSGGGGGVIANSGGEVDEVMTGSGGHGGTGAEGGVVQTGAAWTRTNVANVVNRNVTRIMR